MAQPTPYDRQANFSNFEALNPTATKPGVDLDAELNAVKITSDQILANLARIQRDDGALRNGSVGADQISSSLSIGFTLKGAWAFPFNYLRGDGVTFDSAFYAAKASHLSASGQTPAVRADLWDKLVDFSDFAPAVIADGSVTTVKIADGAFSADAPGRAKMADGFATNAKLANIATGTIKGRATAATGPVEDLTPIQAATVIGAVLQSVTTTYATYGLTGAALVFDNTLPQRTTEVSDIVTLAITPKHASSILQIRATVPVFMVTAGTAAACIFETSSANALAANAASVGAGAYGTIHVAYDVVAGSTSARTYVLAAGGTTAVNIGGNGSTKIFGASMFAQFTITEIRG